jgi:hypothetical protein
VGTLIPIGLGADAEIKDLLNQAFNDTNFQALSAHVQNVDRNLFGPGHNYRTARVASRLRLHPGNAGKRRRWYFLLRNVLPDASDGSINVADNRVITTEEALKAVLTKVLMNANGSFKRIVFDAEEKNLPANTTGQTYSHFIYPSNDNPGLAIGYTMNIILVCPAPLADGVSNDPIPDSDPDPGEQPFAPPVTLQSRQWSARNIRRTAKKGGRKAAKVAKKASRPSARKAPAKKRRPSAKKG